VSSTSSAAPLVVLSPHLDDAVLSCGGRIAHAVEQGRRVIVATVFTRDEPAEPPSALAADLRRWWNLPPGEVMSRRRAEDVEACRRLGAESLHLDLAEAPYRTDGTDGTDGPDAAGAILYPTLGSLYGELAPADAAAESELVRALARFEPEAELLGPLGVGHHVDHQLVRRALLAARPGAALYEEFPYTEWKWFAVARALRALGADGGSRWEEETVPIDSRLLDRRREAIAAYASQVPAMFRTDARLAKQLRRAVRRAGGERIWRRR